jgi:signal transduction histidine kinase/ActR/RegA family two-component response regulator
VPVATLQRVLDEQALPSDWLSVIVDKSGKIVARRPGGEKYAGAEPVYRPDSLTWPSDDTDFYGRTLEGFEVITTRAISAKYGLSTAVAVPTASLFRQFLMPVGVASLGGFAMAGLTLIAMSLLAARLVTGIRALSMATDALGRGEDMALPPAPVRELALVGEALQRAARALAGNRRELEERIAEVSGKFQREAEERQNAEAALAQAQKVEAIGQLTGGIAHDFNNLLAAVVGNLDLLRRRAAWDARAAAYVENAMAAAERGTKLTSQLLVFSRSQQLDLKPVVIADVIDGMRDMLTRTLGPQIRISIEVEDRGVAVLSDRTQLELAVLNLAINARDAMPEGGRLTISTVPLHLTADPELQPGDYVRLSVSDTGTGMTPETAARAFDPFYTTKGIGKGTGLGLSQVFGMASRGAGTARIETQRGHGATLHLFLRQTNARPDTSEHPAGAPPTSALPELQILVIDDDPDVRRLLRDFLTERGLVPREAEDGQTGLEEIEHMRPDLVLLDYAMPGLTGAQVAKSVKDRCPHLQIIFITGFADTAAIQQSVGRDALILRKPFRLADLDALLVQVAAYVSRNDLVPP